MEDRDILQHIQTLVDEEHSLMQMEASGQLEGDQRERFRSIEVHLDQCWDLLRQRRARRNAGLNPNEAQERPANIVENYKQ
ncbi:MAG TPA: DUF2630 family protein [Dictyobacter sp.]|jgi:hypothetical protein|nr:DUF2630 family protein [Dictyobacter sp.]